MKRARLRILIATTCLAVAMAGCGHKEDHGHEHGKAEGHDHGHGHGHGAESPSGASFKAGKGVMLTEETRKILGLEVADVAEEKLPESVNFIAQVYGSRSGQKTLKASGMIALVRSNAITVGQKVHLTGKAGAASEGKVMDVHQAMIRGETEIAVELPETEGIVSGDFLKAAISLHREDAVAVVPRSAILRTAEGNFVYAVNGEAYYRTAVKLGAENAQKVEITDGLLAGDAVVVRPVETLWLIELRATKGGGHSH